MRRGTARDVLDWIAWMDHCCWVDSLCDSTSTSITAFDIFRRSASAERGGYVAAALAREENE